MAKETIVTIGFFDGIHKGHKRLLDVLVQQGKQYNYETVVLTFDRSPKAVKKFLTTLDEKLDILGSFALDRIGVIEYSKEFYSMLPEEFFNNFLRAYFPVQKLIAGYDFTFGRNRAGNIALLRDLCISNGIDLLELGPVKHNEKDSPQSIIVSASHIRNLLQDGRIEQANRLLGRPYAVGGEVIRGTGTGTRMGFPTINIDVPEEKLLPQGIFYAQVIINDKSYTGAVNIGHRPSLPGLEVEGLACEVHVLDFKAKITSGEISLFLHKKIRDEQKFENKSMLKKQIAQDVKVIRGLSNS